MSLKGGSEKWPWKPPYRLHLGCGAVYLSNFINIDSRMPSTGRLDLQADVRCLPFGNRTCQEIMSFHLVEHIPRPDVPEMFRHWFRLLSNNGKLVMELPDFDIIADRYLLGNEEYLKHVFGNQEHEGQFHYWGYSFPRLKKELEEIGFKDVVKKAPTDYHAREEPCFRIEATKLARFEFHLEATNVCTRPGRLRCPYCADNGTRKTGYLDLDLAERILDQIDKLHSEPKNILLFLSGEPLLHPEIGELIRMANKAGKTIIHTNADVLTRERAIEIINAGLGEVVLNLHERPDIGKVPEGTVKNIKQFLEINQHQVESQIWKIIPFPEKIPDEEEVKKRFPGVDTVRLRRPHNWAKRGSVEGAKLIKDKPPFTCEFLYDNLAIYWDGRCPVCCADLNGEWIIGDLKEETLREIDGKLDIILERQLKAKPIPELCSGCERYSEGK